MEVRWIPACAGMTARRFWRCDILIAPMAVISLDHVCKRYGTARKARADDHWALRDVSLEICEGELLALLGPSGSGKTTLLRLIAGLETPTRGEIRIGGQSMDRVKPRDRGVAMVFQDSTLYPHLTARQNLAFALRMRRVAKSAIDHRIAQAAQWLDIEALLDRKPGELSGGERQRAALGKAIVQQPHVLLLDEPLSDLDAPLRSELRSQIKSLQRRLGITTIHVTHDQDEAMALGDRIVVLARGEVQQVGTQAELWHRPANRFVAGFIGNPGMNFIEGRIEQAQGQPCFVASREAFQIQLSTPMQASGAIALGVRPEHCTLSADSSANGIAVQIELIEPRGGSALIHAGTERGLRWTVHVNQSNVQFRVGDRAQLVFNTQAAALFEPGEFGRNLSSMG